MGGDRAAPDRPRQASGSECPSERRAVAAAVAIAALPVLSGTMLAVALPDIATSLHARPGAVVSIVAVYVVVLAVAQPVAGVWADRAGLARTVRLGLVVLVLGSLLAMLSWTLAALLVARSIQALGAALVVPGICAQLIRGRGRDARRFGVLTAVANVVAAVGPVIGALAVAHVGWRGVFAITIALGAAAAMIVPGDQAGDAGPSGPDDAGPEAADDAGPEARRGTAGTPVADLLWDRRVAAAAGLNVLDNVVLHILLLGLPFALTTAGGMAAATAVATLTVAAAATAPVGGRLADRAGDVATVRVGFLVAAAGMLGLAIAGVSPDPATVLAVMVIGAGLGLEFPGLQAAPLRLAPAERRAATAGILASARQAGSAGGALLVAALVATDPVVVFGAGAVLALAALPLAAHLDAAPARGGRAQPAALGLLPRA